MRRSFTTLPVYVGETEVAAGVAIGELFVIQARGVQQRRVEIVHVHLIRDGVVAEFVRRSVCQTALEAAAGEPDGEAGGIVIAAGAVLLGVGVRPNSAPHHTMVSSSRPRCFRSVEQAGDRLVHGAGVIAMLLHVGVLVPGGIVRVVAVIDLHEAHARLAEPPREQALAAKVIGLFLADAVERAAFRADSSRDDQVGRGLLHAPREFIAVDDRLQFAVAGLLPSCSALSRGANRTAAGLLERARGAEIADGRLLRGHPGAADRRAL